MKLHQIRLRGLGPYEQEVLLDLDAIDGEFLCITGHMGAGKSVLAEVWPGALHPKRKTPTRGTFDALADGHGRESFADVAFTMGPHHYRIRHEIGRGESYVWQDGNALPHDKKVSAVGGWLDATMLPPEVVNACVFLGQRSEGLIDADGGDRRAALLRAIGIDAIEALAGKARGLEREAGRVLGEVVAEIARLGPMADGLPAALDRHVTVRAALEDATASRTRASLALTAGRAAMGLHLERERERGEAESRRAGVERRMGDARARLADLEARLVEQATIVAAAPDLADLPARRFDAQDRLRVAGLARDAYLDRERERVTAFDRRSTLEQRRGGALSSLADLEARTTAARALLDGAPLLASRTVAARQLQADVLMLRESSALHAVEAARATGAASRANEAASVERARWSTAKGRIDRAAERTRDADAVREAVVALPAAHVTLDESIRQLVELERTVGQIRESTALSTGERVETLRGALGAVEATPRIEEAHRVARSARERDEGAEQGVEPTILAALDADIAERREGIERFRDRVEALAALAAREGEIAEAERVIAEAVEEQRAAVEAGSAAKAEGIAEGENAARSHSEVVWREARARDASAELAVMLPCIANAERELAGATARLAELDRMAAEARGTVETLTAEIAALPEAPAPLPCPDLATLTTDLAAIDTLATKAREVDAARARVVELEGLRDRAVADLATAGTDLAALPLVPELLSRPDVAALEASLDTAGASIARLTPEMAAAEREVGEAQRAHDAREQAVARRPALEVALADAHLLAECLGIGGVQALEIDAAGPALTANMNRLLHGAYGPRFTAEVNATRASRDGKKRIDETEILILDTSKANRKADVRTYSGGERAHLATAFFLALASYVCNTRGIEAPTLILDEPGGGLPESTVGPWIDMVRAAARIVGASKVIVISHHPQIIEAADAVVHVADGKLTRVR